jgi:hypothetical protein
VTGVQFLAGAVMGYIFFTTVFRHVLLHVPGYFIVVTAPVNYTSIMQIAIVPFILKHHMHMLGYFSLYISVSDPFCLMIVLFGMI